MSNRDVNYLKMLFQSNTNLVFIGVMVFATLVFNSGFLFLLVAGELGLVMLSQLSITQKARYNLYLFIFTFLFFILVPSRRTYR